MEEIVEESDEEKALRARKRRETESGAGAGAGESRPGVSGELGVSGAGESRLGVSEGGMHRVKEEPRWNNAIWTGTGAGEASPGVSESQERVVKEESRPENVTRPAEPHGGARTLEEGAVKEEDEDDLEESVAESSATE